MRVNFFVLLLLFLLAGSCGPFERHHFEVTFINTTDALVCFEGAPGQFGEFGGKCLDQIDAGATTSWDLDCESETDNRAVRLTIGPGGTEIYSRTAACGDWRDSDATFIIKQVGDELVVTDSLPEDAGSP